MLLFFFPPQRTLERIIEICSELWESLSRAAGYVISGVCDAPSFTSAQVFLREAEASLFCLEQLNISVQAAEGG